MDNLDGFNLIRSIVQYSALFIVFFVLFISAVYKSVSGIVYLCFLILAELIRGFFISGFDLSFFNFLNTANTQKFNDITEGNNIFVLIFTFFYLFLPLFLSLNINYSLLAFFMFLILFEFIDGYEKNTNTYGYNLLFGTIAGIVSVCCLIWSSTSEKVLLSNLLVKSEP
jgi:hypothetical protein